MIVRKDDLEMGLEKLKADTDNAWHEVVERITPLIDAAAKRVTPVADSAVEAAKGAKRRAAGLAADTVERIQPSVNTALDKVAPAVDRAQKAVQDDLLPALIQALQHAAETPVEDKREIAKWLDARADASLDALKGELVQTKKSSKFKKVATIAAISAVLGALVIAVRAFLGSREDWAAYEPDEPYVYPDDDYEIDEVLDDAALGEVDGDESAEVAEGQDEIVESAPYGEGSYAGPNPPEGFEIKGNERSMKYHVPGAAGHARTHADVWFISEDAAQAAGFVRSQR
ncbi:MAG: hypothetical protein LBE83_06490 [Propionibacteriaceae bacterium]|jgi:hypothetical protein|nr:hypothetical protein [Propionibacteriaceae bacterium]